MQAAARKALAGHLTEQVDVYWEFLDDAGWEVSYGHRKISDWHDVDDARGLWRQMGFDPDLSLPKPTLPDPKSEDSLLKTCVEFDDSSTFRWNYISTAMFIMPINWGTLTRDSCRLAPSLGSQLQDEPGLFGVFNVILQAPKETRQVFDDGAEGTSDMWGFVAMSGAATPYWYPAKGDPSAATQVPLLYSGTFDRAQPAWKSEQHCLAALLPPELKSPHFMGLGAAISESLGWFALVYGMKSLIDGWRDINEVLATTPLRGFE
jgi:hypothetical protein